MLGMVVGADVGFNRDNGFGCGFAAQFFLPGLIGDDEVGGVDAAAGAAALAVAVATVADAAVEAAAFGVVVIAATAIVVTYVHAAADSDAFPFVLGMVGNVAVAQGAGAEAVFTLGFGLDGAGNQAAFEVGTCRPSCRCRWPGPGWRKCRGRRLCAGLRHRCRCCR